MALAWGSNRERRAEVGDVEEYEMRGATPLYNLADVKEAAAVTWRVDCFEDVGVPNQVAIVLALRRDVERTRVEGLMEAGCPVDLLLDIVL